MILEYCTKFPKLKGFAAGLAASQIISFFHIYHSNINLSDTVHNLKQAGHLVVPDGQVLSSFNNFFPAFKAALFFTGTAGILITLASIASFIILARFRAFLRIHLIAYMSLWGGISLYLILQRQSITSMFTALPPLVVYLVLQNTNHNTFMANCTSKKKNSASKNTSKEKTAQEFIILILAISISASLLYIKADKTFFLRVRDYLLLGSPAGKIVNNFYYQYTLLAAEAVKSPLQKQIKSCWLDPNIKKINELENILFRYGWLKSDDRSSAGLVIDKKYNINVSDSPPPVDKNYIVLKKHINTIISNKTILMEPVNIDVFLQNPLYYLKSYSKAVDEYKILRYICALGLMIGLPIFLFCLIFFAFALVFDFIICVLKLCTDKRYSALLSAAATVYLSALLLFYVYPAGFNPGRRGGTVDSENCKIKTMLDSHSSRIRVEALRRICLTKKNSIWKYPETVDRLRNGLDAEKYWLANALGLSRNLKSVPVLKALSEDSSINVQCAAIKALVRLKGSIPKMSHHNPSVFFKEILMQSKSWYVQRAAYYGIKQFSNEF